MKNGRVVGVGCFGKPENFNHVFAHVLKGYFFWGTGGLEIKSLADTLMNDRTHSFPDAVFNRDNLWIFEPDADSDAKMKKITGFFLALDKCSLSLCVFVQGRDQRQERFTSIRQFRLMGQ